MSRFIVRATTNEGHWAYVDGYYEFTTDIDKSALFSSVEANQVCSDCLKTWIPLFNLRSRTKIEKIEVLQVTIGVSSRPARVEFVD